MQRDEASRKKNTQFQKVIKPGKKRKKIRKEKNQNPPYIQEQKFIKINIYSLRNISQRLSFENRKWRQRD